MHALRFIFVSSDQVRWVDFVVYDSGLDLVVICIPVTLREEFCNVLLPLTVKQWFVQHNEMVFLLFTLCHHVYYNSLLLQLRP